MTNAEMIAREHCVLYPIYQRLPIAISHAQGCWITDLEGRQYLDCLSGIGVNALGHSHQRILEALELQMRRYLHVSNFYYIEPQIKLAEMLLNQSGYAAVIYTNSGTEAWEAALKLSRRWGYLHNKRGDVIGFTGGFHGRTYGALSLMDKPLYKDGMGPFLQATCVVPYNDIAALEVALSEQTCAVGLELIQGEGGIIEASDGFVQRLEQLRQHYGFLLIADEVQSGCGRTGQFFAFERYGIRPDIVTVAKALGGGIPLGAVLVDERLTSIWQRGQHGSTYGGNPLACAAGIVVLEELQNGLLESVQYMGGYLRDGLERLAAEFTTLVRSVRGRGLMLGLELSIDAGILRNKLLERGVITNATATTVLRLLPPFIISKDECDILLDALHGSLSSCLTEQAFQVANLS